MPEGKFFNKHIDQLCWANICSEKRLSKNLGKSIDTTRQSGIIYIVSKARMEGIIMAYQIHDSYWAPQCGCEVTTFEEFYEMEDYLDANPDVMERIREGYATITEA